MRMHTARARTRPRKVVASAMATRTIPPPCPNGGGGAPHRHTGHRSPLVGQTNCEAFAPCEHTRKSDRTSSSPTTGSINLLSPGTSPLRVPLRRRTPGRSGPGGVTRTIGRASLSEDPADEHCAPRDQEHAHPLRARAVQFKFSHADDIEKHDLRLSSGRLGPAGG